MATVKDTTTAADVASPVERRASRASRVSSINQQDENELAQFGYKQELKRDWGLMHNFGISFSIIVCSALQLLHAAGFLSDVWTVSNHRHYNPLPIWARHWRAGRHVGGLDRRLVLHYVRCAGNGRDRFRDTYGWRTILLGCYACPC